MSAQRYKSVPGPVMMDQIVKALIAKHGWKYTDVCQNPPEPEVLELIQERVRRYAPAVLGKLTCAYPEADLYGVFCGTWLDKYDSGPRLLQDIVVAAIVARLRVVLILQPSYVHDCSKCTYLGSMWAQNSADFGWTRWQDRPRVVDLYDASHQGVPSVLVRYGDGEEEYMTRDPLSAGDEPHFAQAAKLLEELVGV